MVAAKPMRLVIDDGLSFLLEKVHPSLADAVRQRLGYFLQRSPQPNSREILIGGDPPEQPFHLCQDAKLLQSGSLGIYRRGDELFFEVPGIHAWCNPRQGLGGIRASRPEPHMAHTFVNLALGSMLIELALPLGRYGIHAAAVAVEGRGVLLPGASGCGKSTIFRNAANYGLAVLSDDLVWLHERKGGFRLLPFPHPTDGGHYGPTVEQVPLAAMIFPRIGALSPSSISPMELAPSLQTLMQQSGFLTPGPLAGRRFQALVRAAASVPCYRLSAGPDQREVPALIERTLLPRAETSG